MVIKELFQRVMRKTIFDPSYKFDLTMTSSSKRELDDGRGIIRVRTGNDNLGQTDDKASVGPQDYSDMTFPHK